MEILRFTEEEIDIMMEHTNRVVPHTTLTTISEFVLLECLLLEQTKTTGRGVKKVKGAKNVKIKMAKMANDNKTKMSTGTKTALVAGGAGLVAGGALLARHLYKKHKAKKAAQMAAAQMKGEDVTKSESYLNDVDLYRAIIAESILDIIKSDDFINEAVSFAIEAQYQEQLTVVNETMEYYMCGIGTSVESDTIISESYFNETLTRVDTYYEACELIFESMGSNTFSVIDSYGECICSEAVRCNTTDLCDLEYDSNDLNRSIKRAESQYMVSESLNNLLGQLKHRQLNECTVRLSEDMTIEDDVAEFLMDVTGRYLNESELFDILSDSVIL